MNMKDIKVLIALLLISILKSNCHSIYYYIIRFIIVKLEISIENEKHEIIQLNDTREKERELSISVIFQLLVDSTFFFPFLFPSFFFFPLIFFLIYILLFCFYSQKHIKWVIRVVVVAQTALEVRRKDT